MKISHTHHVTKKGTLKKNPPKKIPIKSITITRGEGRTEECGIPHVVNSFIQADSVLLDMARSAPKSGGYDKVDVKFLWQDGNTWDGRFDIKYPGEPNNDLATSEHLRSFADYVINRSQYSTPKDKLEMSEFLEKYKITD